MSTKDQPTIDQLVTLLADHVQESERRDVELRIQIGVRAVAGETHPAVTVARPLDHILTPYVNIKQDLSPWRTKQNSSG